MAFAHPEYLVPSVFALVAALYPLPWHLRTRNIATVSMIFWMTLLNIVHTVNCIVWSDNTKVVAKPWGDISATIIVGYNYALPTAHLILAKQLESYTSLRTSSPLYDHTSRRRHRMFDLFATFAVPVVGILLHLSMMDRRFYVVEGFGPLPATYWDTWGVIGMAIIPILIAFSVAVYTVMALVNIHLRRQQMLTMIASDASVNKDQFYRLMFLTLAELGTCGIRAIFNLMSFQKGPQPMGNRGPPSRNMKIIEEMAWNQISKSGMTVLNLSFFTVIACSYTFLLCFATSTETKKFYWSLARKVFPCMPERDVNGRISKLGSLDDGGSRSYGSSRGKVPTLASTTGFSAAETDLKSPIPPTTPALYTSAPPPSVNRSARQFRKFSQKDISLEEMLTASPTDGVNHLDKDEKWAESDSGSISRGLEDVAEEDPNRVFLAPYDWKKEEKPKEDGGPHAK